MWFASTALAHPWRHRGARLLQRRHRELGPDQFLAGTGAVKFTWSGVGPVGPGSVVTGRYDRGRQATRPSTRISWQTSSALADSPPRTSAAWIRR